MNEINKKQFAVGGLAPKAVFSYGGVNWSAIEHEDDGVLCLAEKVFFDKAFDDDNRNNWKESSLREHLNNEFLIGLGKNGATEEAFISIVTDLTTYDGSDDYGSCENIIGLISFRQYCRYRGIIQNAEGCWWTCTPYSTEDPYYGFLLFVMPCGSTDCDDDLNSHYTGARPLCKLKPNTLVTIVSEEKEI